MHRLLLGVAQPGKSGRPDREPGSPLGSAGGPPNLPRTSYGYGPAQQGGLCPSQKGAPHAHAHWHRGLYAAPSQDAGTCGQSHPPLPPSGLSITLSVPVTPSTDLATPTEDHTTPLKALVTPLSAQATPITAPVNSSQLLPHLTMPTMPTPLCIGHAHHRPRPLPLSPRPSNQGTGHAHHGSQVTFVPCPSCAHQIPRCASHAPPWPRPPPCDHAPSPRPLPRHACHAPTALATPIVDFTMTLTAGLRTISWPRPTRWPRPPSRPRPHPARHAPTALATPLTGN